MVTFRAFEFSMAFVVCLDLCTSAVFIRYLFKEIRLFGWHRFRLQAAGSILMRSIGNIMVFGWAWYYFETLGAAAHIDWFRNHPVQLAGVLVLALGALWKIRVFTPEQCGHLSWVLSGGFSLLVAGVLAFT